MAIIIKEFNLLYKHPNSGRNAYTILNLKAAEKGNKAILGYTTANSTRRP